MKVLITSRSFGNISREPIDILEQAGLSYTLMGQNFDQQAFEQALPEYDALIIGVNPLPEAALARCDKLQIICKHGAGLDNIPLELCRKMGIVVTNAPGTNSNAVADHAFALMLAACRGVLEGAQRVKNGVWKPVTGRDVYKKTLGLIGFGAIAKNVARRANGFSMQVLAYDPFIKEPPQDLSFVRMTSLEEILRNADIVSVHVPLTDETRDLIAAEQLAMMKEGAYIVNTARGGIVNEQDIADAVRSGHIAAAAFDVATTEPIAADNPLLGVENIIVTPHMGMYSKEALGAVSTICARNAAAKLCGGELEFVVG
jgi:D-3-phosphoglycerate dehydrogenase